MEDKPTYYGILPAEVRYCKGLTPNAKILYTELTALTNKNGYCHANNSYFAELYNVSDRTISQWFAELSKFEFIEIQIIKNNSGTYRRIFLSGTKISSNGGMKKTSTPYEENFYPKEYNKEEYYKDLNNNKEYKESSLSQKNEESVFDLKYYSELCEILGLLTELTQAKYNIPKTADKVKKYKPYTLIKELFESGFNRSNFVDVINCKYKEWAGSSMAIHLVPETLFRKSNFEKYVTQTQIITNKQTPIKDESGNYSDTKEGREQFILNIRERAVELLRKKRTGETYDSGF